jgi:HPt (histidine-containing phosphotransfer) domain-containing protein
MTHTLDLSVLEELACHDAAKVRKYAFLFIQSLEDILVQIDSAVACHDLNVLGNMGHRAKSTALNIGATAFAHECLLLEQAARAQDSATSLAIATSLRPMFAPIHAALLHHLGAPA